MNDMNTFLNAMGNLVGGIRALNIPRIEDLPYWTSPPIQFVYESTATLNLGTYIWNDSPTALVPNRPILGNALYFFRSVTLAADVEELDFTANIVTTPQFYMFRQSDARAVMFREPIQMVKFFEQFDYRLTWLTAVAQDQLFAAFTGSLSQGAGLIGKGDITLKAVISAQEIVDDKYINLFRSAYPDAGQQARLEGAVK